MIAAGLQLDIAWEDPEENFRRAAALAGAAVAAGARLVALPEMFATGFSMAEERTSAHAAATRAFLQQLARRHALWVLAGFAEPGPARPFNTAALFAPDGAEALTYHKIHPFSYADEHHHYAAGTTLPTVAVEGLRLTALVCYDLRFAEPFRAAAADTDLFVVIANWPAARRHHWSTLLRARAIEAQCFVLGVNRVGEGDGLPYAGDSALIDPLGETIASRSAQTGLVLGAVDPAAVAAARARFSFLADRRPEVYEAIAAERGHESTQEPQATSRTSSTTPMNAP